MNDAAAIVLAGGRSERFGKNKLLLGFGRSTVLGELLSALKPSVREIVVVTGFYDQAIREVIADTGIHWANNPDVYSGMSASLQIGLSAIKSNAQAILVTPADLPLVREATVRSLTQTWTTGSIVIPRYRGKKGHPVVLDRNLFRNPTPEKWMYEIIRNHPKKIIWLDTEDEGVVLDLDTEEDYRNLLTKARQF